MLEVAEKVFKNREPIRTGPFAQAENHSLPLWKPYLMTLETKRKNTILILWLGWTGILVPCLENTFPDYEETWNL